jgi:deoxycytidylate deaminase
METKNQKIIVYPYLPEEGKIYYVSEDNVFMVEAKDQARKSNDHNTPTGAVIVSVGEMVSKDHNNAPISNPKLINLHKKYCIRKILGIPSGHKYWLCPGCATNSSHAEYRAVLNIQKQEIKNLDNPELYLWGHWWCCKPCWDKMLEVGIKKVFLVKGSESLFERSSPNNILGKQFK